LLELEGESKSVAVLIGIVGARGGFQEQDALEKVVRSGALHRIASLGAGDGFADVLAVAVTYLAAGIDVGAVDRKISPGFANGLFQQGARDLTGPEVAAAE
jgi:hypothetical protein